LHICTEGITSLEASAGNKHKGKMPGKLQFHSSSEFHNGLKKTASSLHGEGTTQEYSSLLLGQDHIAANLTFR